MKKIISTLGIAVLAMAALVAGASAAVHQPERQAVTAASDPLRAELQAFAEQPGAAPVVEAFKLDYEAAKAKLENGDVLGALLALLAGAGGIGLAMTTLSVERSRNYELGDLNDLPVVASDIIYEGAAVGDSGTNAFRPLAAGDRFAGFAEATADNSGGAEGAKYVRVRRNGRVQLPISGFDVGDVGKAVYASDDDTFTLTAGTNSHIGKAVRFVGTGTAIVAFDADNPMGAVAEITDNSGGTASDTIATIPATYDAGAVGNAIATLAAKVNAVLELAR